MLVLLSCKSKHDTNATPSQNEVVENDYSIAQEDSVIKKETLPESYSYQWIDSKDIPPVAIVIDDFGQISGDLLKGFAELDKNITFAILPDLPNSVYSSKLAHENGHEVIVHIPMEAVDKKQNPGKRYIKDGQNKEYTIELVNDFVKQIPHAIGANNHMGSGVTADYTLMHNIIKTLDRHGLFFLDSKTSSKSVAFNVAKDLGVGYAARDIFLDVPDVSTSTIDKKINELSKFKGRIEPIIVISHCHNKEKLVAMHYFIDKLKILGIKLVPISVAIKKQSVQA